MLSRNSGVSGEIMCSLLKYIQYLVVQNNVSLPFLLSDTFAGHLKSNDNL